MLVYLHPLLLYFSMPLNFGIYLLHVFDNVSY